MRSPRDRIRHVILFEILGLALVTPLGMWVFGMPPHAVSVVAISGSTLAMGLNYGYNLAFDRLLLRLTGSVRKGLGHRLVHAVLFEITLLAGLMPFIAWYLDVGLWQALTMDISLAGFYLVYAFVFNWGYDLIFPLPDPQARQR
ncbi:PACE efflux transporter [Pseudodonghicola flavimaris]|uniref:PACE efflux transporter n=1 Tax=Pseudodonghicola flavimaris TaxID=3050036 RepID=A0ABT7F5J7_9RHOB|nr:PACE efflux transporter [Pseudodonghicola flavimaris]MDK3019894.1 PACE efflux transporter [Pseudodonghicola flavimaris]